MRQLLIKEKNLYVAVSFGSGPRNLPRRRRHSVNRYYQNGNIKAIDEVFMSTSD